MKSTNNSYQESVSNSRFRVLKLVLHIGAVPLLMKEENILYTLYKIVSRAQAYALYIASIMDVIMHKNEMKHVMVTARLIGTFTLELWVNFYLSVRIDTINSLLSSTEIFTWEDLPVRDPATGNLTKAGWISVTQTLARNVLYSVFSYHVIQSTYRMVTSHVMVFNSWYPFDASQSPVYELINISQLWSSLMHAAGLYGFLALYAVLICVACSQLEKLRNNLLNIKQKVNTSVQLFDAETHQKKYEAEQVVYSQDFPLMQNQLNACIHHHQQILWFLQELENGLNPFICGFFLILFLTVCFDTFSAVTSWGDLVDLSQAAVLYATLMGILYIMCANVEQLKEHAEAIRDTAFACDWVGTPLAFQKCILGIIRQGNVTVNLTAGKFVPVSNATMLNIVNETISFFMFLLHMKERSEVSSSHEERAE